MCKNCFREVVVARKEIAPSSSTSPRKALPKMAELLTAVKSGDYVYVRKLFEALPDEKAVALTRYQAPATKESLLFSACVVGHLRLVALLLERGRGQSELYTAWGAGPLHAAAERCHEAVVRLLLKHGANVDAQTKYGDTPLHLAANRGHYAVVKLIVEAGCNMELRNSKNRTAFNDSISAGHGRVARYLSSVMKRDWKSLKLDPADTLMETRPFKTQTGHPGLDRCNSCPDTEQTDSHLQSDLRSESNHNDLHSEIPDAYNIPVVGDPPGSSAVDFLREWEFTAPSATRTSGGVERSSAAAKRQDYRTRSSSDSRIDYLERMVRNLQSGLAATQEELGETRGELRRVCNMLMTR